MALMRSFSIRIGWVLAFVLGGYSVAIPAAEVDLPARIGRIGLISGTVETWSPGDKGWAAASLNTPVSSGWAMWAGRDARAEVRIGSASVHLASDSQVNFSRIDDSVVTLEAARGSVRVRVRSLGEEDRFLLHTDGTQIEVRQPGDFRLDFDPSRHRATLRVFSGRAQILGFGDRMLLVGGQQAQIDTASRQLLSLGELTRNEFDSWAENRSREQDRSPSARYVSPEMTGIEALDEHGRWDKDPTYGAIWYPQVVVGWAPYRFGHWSWIGPWGWTWIDDAPWGFAPFHYGRWIDLHGRWGWVPGRYEHRPVYAPALVGFYGGASHVGVNVSIGIGNIGWFPLGPAEVYRPTYGASINYVRRVNISHVTNVTNIGNPRGGRGDDYRYARRPDAATFVPGAVFSGARPVGPAFRSMDRSQVGNMPVAQRPVLPERPVGSSPRDGQSAGPSPRPSPPVSALPSQGRSPDEAAHRIVDKTIPAAPTARPLNDSRHDAGRHLDPGLDNRQRSRPLPVQPAQTNSIQTVPVREVHVRESVPPAARSQDSPRAAPPRPAPTTETARAPERGQAPREVRNPNEARQIRQVERENQKVEKVERRIDREQGRERGNRMMP